MVVDDAAVDAVEHEHREERRNAVAGQVADLTPVAAARAKRAAPERLAVDRDLTGGEPRVASAAVGQGRLGHQHVRRGPGRVLDERPGHKAPLIRFEPELEDSLSEELAQQTLRTVIHWGRYAELYSYDDEAEVFSLENPSPEST